MDSRKIISFGKSSHVVNLPNSWIKKNRFKKGTDLFFKECGDSITFFKKPKSKKDVILDLDKFELRTFSQALVSFYVKNVSSIKIKSKKILENLELIKTLKEKLFSLEIISIEKDFIVLKDFSDPKNIEISILIQKLFAILGLFLKELFVENRLKISHIKTDVSKLYFFILKAINFKVETHFDFYNLHAFSYFKIALFSRRVGGVLEKITRLLISDTKYQKSLKKISKDFVSFFDFIVSCYKDNQNFLKKMDKFTDVTGSLYKELSSSKFADKKDLVQLLRQLISNLKPIFLSLVDLNL